MFGINGGGTPVGFIGKTKLWGVTTAGPACAARRRAGECNPGGVEGSLDVDAIGECLTVHLRHEYDLPYGDQRPIL